MYTELVLKCSIKNDTPEYILNILNYLFNGGEEPDCLPDHEFFSCPRWHFIGRCSSYYHVPFNSSRFEEGYIFSRSDLKNYDDEIDKFIDWIQPYLEHYEGDCIGWKWYEENPTPDLIIV